MFGRPLQGRQLGGAASLSRQAQGLYQSYPVGPLVLTSIGWDQTNFPLVLTKTGGSWASDFDRTDYLPDSHFTTTYYVDVATGSDSNNGTTTGTKLKSIHAAITKGNATAAPYRALITAGTYPRANSVSNSGTVIPTQDCALVAVGGSVVTGVFDDLSWPASPDATFTNSYIVARSSVGRVFDRSNLDSFGNYVELTKVASAALVDSTPGSWAQVSGNLHVRRADGAAVTNANTRVYLTTANAKLTSSSKKLYMSGIHLEGGAANDQNPLFIDGVANTVVICEDCSFKYGGSNSAFLRDGVAALNSSGLFAFIRCEASCNAKDGFNAHWTTDSTRATFVLTEGCTSRDNGKFGSTSNNGITGHETVVWLDVAGDYAYDHGGEARFIDDSRLGAFGTAVGFDQGDGATATAGFHADGTTKFWLVDCSAQMDEALDNSVLAESTARIYLRNFVNTVGTMDPTGIFPF